jgi:ArsR family transcriptional regulator
MLLVVDLAHHHRDEIMSRHAHRWPGFDDSLIAQWLDEAGCALLRSLPIPGAMEVRLWAAQRLPALARTPEPALEL